MKTLRTRPAPSKIKKLIERFNLLPFGAVLPSLPVKSGESTTYASRSYSQFSKTSERWTDHAVCGLIKLFDDLPSRLANEPHVNIGEETEIELDYREKAIAKMVSNFSAYIWGQKSNVPVGWLTYFAQPGLRMTNEFKRARAAVDRYEKFVKLRNQVAWTIHWAQRHPSWDLQFPGPRKTNPTKQQRASDVLVGKRKLSEDFILPFQGSIFFTIGSDGIFSPKVDEFSDAILSEKIDMRRIRSCQKCGSVFWAGRVDSFCCSQRCYRERNIELLPPKSQEEKRIIWRLAKQQQRETIRSRDAERVRLRSKILAHQQPVPRALLTHHGTLDPRE